MTRKSSAAHKNKIRRLLKAQNNKCFYCDRRIMFKPEPGVREATIDHLKPRSDGGNNEMRNLVAACSECNTEKGSLPYAVYMKFRHDRDRMKYLNVVIVDQHKSKRRKQS